MLLLGSAAANAIADNISYCRADTCARACDRAASAAMSRAAWQSVAHLVPNVDVQQPIQLLVCPRACSAAPAGTGWHAHTLCPITYSVPLALALMVWTPARLLPLVHSHSSVPSPLPSSQLLPLTAGHQLPPAATVCPRGPHLCRGCRGCASLPYAHPLSYRTCTALRTQPTSTACASLHRLHDRRSSVAGKQGSVLAVTGAPTGNPSPAQAHSHEPPVAAGPPPSTRCFPYRYVAASSSLVYLISRTSLVP